MLKQKHQSGFALLFVVIALLGMAMVGFSDLLNKTVSQQAQQKRIDNIKRLKLAKDALLAYSVDYKIDNDVGDIGKLPCPDVRDINTNPVDTGGIQDGSCGLKGVNTVGYLPYKSLGLGKVTDSDNECFWYVVSANYKNNSVYGLRNWDSNGFLKVVDENGTLQHGNTEEDYPIALIISPGKSINQNRAGVDDLSDCQANYDISNYLEGGPNIDYSADLPLTADTEWTFLQPSSGAALKNRNYNDQIIAVYKDELWDKVKAMKDLDTTNPIAAIKTLTDDLATCLHTYMTTKSNLFNSNAVYPAVMDIADYTDSSLYQDNAIGARYGRFPQVISDSETDDSAAAGFAITSDSPTRFVEDYCATSISVGGSGVELDLELWENWKDHFFLVVADDFMPGNTNAITAKCGVGFGECLQINGKLSVAAIVLFANEGVTPQDRTLVGLTTDLEIWNQYLDGTNQKLYDGGFGTRLFSVLENDYASCVVYDYVSDSLGAEAC